MYDERLSQSLPRVQDRIATALARAGRTDAVRLIAVTKGHAVAAVEAAARAGITAVGENRVQELDEKRTALADAMPEVEWHLIGHLQRNKARRAIALFDVMHSVDSPRLARTLSDEAVRATAIVHTLVQVNLSGEATKGGFEGDAVVERIVEVCELPGLHIHGLMTMAPFTDDETVIRGTFEATRVLLERCAGAGARLHGRELSMGMSSDYELAIEEGSTMVRIGTTLFGER